MSCSARLPVYTVIIAALIPNQKVLGIFSLQAITMLSLYLLGIFGAAAVSWILKKTFLSREPAFFIMELPPLRRPSFRLIFREIWDRVKLFCKSAGTVILACSLILWFVLSYPRTSNNESPKLVDSYAGTIGTSIEPILKPIGLNWEMGIGIVASFAAREVFVSALATIYNLSDDDESEGYKSLISILEEKGKNNEITLPSTLSLLVFYVFACQCISTLAITKRETGGWKWPFVMFTYMTLLAYVASYMTYHLGNKFFVN
jgi:ferrous iron transport protein B